MSRMSDGELAAFVLRHVRWSESSTSELSDVRSRLTRRYFGKTLGNERADQSSFTTREVQETVEWAIPSLLRGFLGSPNAVSFEPISADDEELAEQETDVVNHRILRANGGDGFIQLSNWIKDALLNPTAYLKVCLDEHVESKVHELSDVLPVQLADLMDDEGIEILEQSSRRVEIPVPGLDIGEEHKQYVEVFDLRIRETREVADIQLVGIPGEDVYVDRDLTTTNLDHARFVAHKVRKTFSELIREGYDREKLEEASSGERFDYRDEERLEREDFDVDRLDYGMDEGDVLENRLYEVIEAHAWVDYEGSGESQFRRIVVIGTDVFENEEVSYQPLVAMSSSLFPHRHQGVSLGMMVESYQELQTELHRQLLDNIARVNTQRMYVDVGAMLPGNATEDAMNDRDAGAIPLNGMPSQSVMPEPVTPMAQHIMPVIDMGRMGVASRTGVSPDNQMDSNTLMNTPYGSTMAAAEKAGERLETIARNMAETGWKNVFRKAHYLCMSRPDIVSTVKLRGKWVDVDASNWIDRSDVMVNVGLGFNNKQQMLILVTQLLEIMERAAPLGLVDEKKAYNALSEWIQAAGVGHVAKFFKDPNEEGWQPPQPPPDPNQPVIEATAAKFGAEASAVQEKSSREGYSVKAKVDIDHRRLALEERKLEFEREKLRSDTDIRRMELENERLELENKSEVTRANVEKTEVQSVKVMAETDKIEVETDKLEAETEKLDKDMSEDAQSGNGGDS